MKKLYLAIVLLFIIMSCSKDDPNVEEDVKNLAPKDFEMKIKEVSHNSATITWDQVIDPENDPITYSILLNQSPIIGGLSELTYKLANLTESTNYTVQIIAQDSFGNKTSKSLSFTTEKYYLKYFKSYDYGLGNYNGYAGGILFNIIKTKDKSYIIAGKSTRPNGDASQFFVLKIDYKGNEIWKKFYNYRIGDATNCRIIESATGLLLAADKHVLSLDNDGNLIWHRKIDSYELPRQPNEIKSVAQDKDNNIYLVGSRTDPKEEVEQEAVLTKLDYLGNIVWEKSYRSTARNFFNDIKINSSNELIIFGTKETSGFTYAEMKDGTKRGQTDFWVLKTNSEGEIIWDKSFGDGRFDFSSQLIIKRNGNYVFAGYSWGAYDISNGRVFEIDSNGNEIWNITTEENDNIMSVAETLDGGYVTTGYIGAQLSNALSVCKFDNNGKKDWRQNYYIQYTYLIGHSILAAEDGGYVIAGANGKNYYQGDEKPKIVIYKTDPFGNFSN
ncbi:hypothetical protein BC749_1245 [Flavobacterium araucananum]|uniref:Fibronectin type-III domain-containing protein n=1 Tax=Flavobacterium araucananum TaxID=946678 RepID=A0A227NRV1_9FLAO|nr:hypothetical protein [Flavobacterium araucananum]OXE99618.1 hypothetical protein B0A64_21185 [Flavobacterium araucananum]PWJ89258.1 hypothetical protein BC749_1245 [Flavobacterium araucananum]